VTPTSSVSFGLAVPSSICGFDAVGEECGAVSRSDWIDLLEDSGVESLWVLDQPAGRTATPEPLSLMAFMAALTSRVRLGIAILIGAARGPVAAAKSIVTLDWLSGGRIDIGLGIGPFRLYPAYGLDRARGGGYGTIFDEFIEILDRLLRQESVSFDGRSWSLQEVSISPRPRQRPRPPLWIGGASDASLKRAIRLGGYWIGAGRQTSTEFRSLAARLQELHDEAATEVKLTISKRVYLVVDDDLEAAERAVRYWFDMFYGRPEWGPAVSLFGSAESVRSGLQDLIDAGANHLLLHPLIDDLEQYRRVTTEIISPMARTTLES
jgi:alkanesulfonate monooxygenase SsuD/methylene tetrahydromethanopterin reductase-like flavin-dependent oxidoreductase (luciferase family)